MVITSLDNDRIKGYIKLKERKNRKKNNEFLVEGMHLVLEACKKGIVKEIILEEEAAFITDLPVVYVSKEIMKKLSEMDSPSNVMAVCSMLDSKIIGEKILLLDDIQDPGNLGTIIRSAMAFNVDTIVLSPNTVDLYNPKVVRATQGMMFHINIVIDELSSVINDLKKNKIPVYGTKVNSGKNVSNLDGIDKSKYALVMGNEGNGVSQEILDMCDDYLHIKMNKKVESLNVGVATSIILYELNK
jgi:TrmH family RNA methyltransferase